MFNQGINKSRVIAIALAIGVAACSSSGATGGLKAPPRPDPTRMDSSEIRNHGYNTVYQAIQTVHADWFRPVGGPKNMPSQSRAIAAPTVGIFLDGSSKEQGGIDYLKSLVPGDVSYVKHLTPSESLARFGTGWSWGAILVVRTR